MNCERTDVTATKEDWFDDVGVGCERESRAAYFKESLVICSAEDRVAECREENTSEQIGRKLATATVTHQDRFFIENRKRTVQRTHWMATKLWRRYW